MLCLVKYAVNGGGYYATDVKCALFYYGESQTHYSSKKEQKNVAPTLNANPTNIIAIKNHL